MKLKNLKLIIPELFDKEFPEIIGAEMHLLVIDDYSPDKSGDLIKILQRNIKTCIYFKKIKKV